MTKETKKLINTRNEAWTKYRQYSSQRNHAHYKQLRNQTVQSVWKDHDNYRKKVIRSFKGNPKKFFGYMRSLQTVKPKVVQLLNRKVNCPKQIKRQQRCCVNFPKKFL